MAALSELVRLIDLASDTVLASTANVEDMQIGRRADASGTLRFRVPLADPFAGLLIAAWGGPTYTAPIRAYLVEVSQDGGAVWDSAMWVEHGTVALSGPQAGVTLDGKDIFSGFERTYIDRVRYTNVACSDILYAAPGTIALDADALMAPGGTFPHQRGLLRSVPARASLKGAYRLAFAGVADPDIADVRVTMDSNEDSVARNLTTLAHAATGAAVLTSSLPVGIHQHYAVDVPNRTVLLGYVGRAPALTLVLGDPYTLDETRQAAIAGDGLTLEPSNEECVAQGGFLGGADNHGLPDGARITALLRVRTQHSPTASDWWDSILLVGVSTGDGGGGVFYLFDKTLYPMSGRMDVAAIAYDDATDTVYAAAGTGVYASPFKTDGGPWSLLGGLTAACTKVWTPSSGIVFAVAADPRNGPGGNGAYRHPQLAGEPDNTAVGYAGWTRLTPASGIVDAAGDDSALYYLEANAPATLTCHLMGDTTPHPIDTPLGEQITGLDLDATRGRIFVRTGAGALGLYYLNRGSVGPMVDANADTSLADAYGALSVNRVLPYAPGGSTPPINGLAVALLAATDRGLWYTTSPTGGNWKPAAGQNGMTDVAGTLVAAGAPQTILGRRLTQVDLASERSLYTSRTGGVFFSDILAGPLDLGPFFAAEAQANGQVPFPGNNVGALGSGVPVVVEADNPPSPALADVGGYGTIVEIGAGDPYLPGPTEVYARRMTELNDFTYRYYDFASLAPYTAYKPAELVEMTADDARGAITAAGELAIEHKRYVQQARQQQVILNVQTQYSTTGAAARFLKPGDQVAVRYSLTVTDYDGRQRAIAALTGQAFYVLDYQSRQAAGCYEVDLKLGTIMAYASSPDDLAEIVGGVSDGLSQDRRARKVRVR